MAVFDTIDKTYFEVKPKADPSAPNADNVVFCGMGFKLSLIRRISDVSQFHKAVYTFGIQFEDTLEWTNFYFERKADCLSAQRELCRAWTRTGEFAYVGEPTSTE